MIPMLLLHSSLQRYRQSWPRPISLLHVHNRDFRQPVKKTDSVIRLDKIATIIRTRIVGRIGELPPELRSRVNEKITELYRI
jgi:mRNA interferase MazF